MRDLFFPAQRRIEKARSREKKSRTFSNGRSLHRHRRSSIARTQRFSRKFLPTARSHDAIVKGVTLSISDQGTVCACRGTRSGPSFNCIRW
jgi:hypothetical protein